MSLRHSLDLIRMVCPEAGTTALEHEILAERASSLGTAERKVVEALTRLKAAEPFNDTALATARQLVWEYFVQRELVGFRKHTDIIQDLNISPEVLAGLGAMTSHKA